MFLNEKFGEKVKSLIKVQSVAIDGPIFNLHCKITTLMLLFACATISLKQYVATEGPIQCIVGGFTGDKMEKERTKVVQTFCWINATYTLIPNASATNRQSSLQEDESEKIYHKYYQWVSLVLFLQAVAFYAPKWFWKLSEGQLMKHLTRTDKVERKLTGEKERLKKRNDLVQYFIQRLEFQVHRAYALWYWFYEILCLVNTITQVFLIDRFLNGNFLTYGLTAFDEMEFDPEAPLSVLTFPGMTTMDIVFPMQTKCTFYKYGPTGSINMSDALCILVLNSYNRYIFLMMWYWFLVLGVLLTLVLFHRITCVLVPQLRYIHVLLRMKRNSMANEAHVVVRHLTVADWWVLYTLKGNVNSILFRDVILEMSKILQSRRKDN